MNLSFNVIALIPFVFFLWLFLRSRKKQNAPSTILIGLYLVGSLFAVFLDLDIALPLHNQNKEEYLNFIIYTVLLVIFLLPSFSIRKIESIQELRFFKKNSLILNVLSILAWISFLYLLPFAIKSMAMDSLAVRSSLGIGEINVLPKNIVTTITTGIASFYPMYIFLFYMSYVQKRVCL